jgi:hypothetical protein
MNPFGHMSNSHNVRTVLLSIYNLLPWLCNKRKYMMMPILILCPQQPGINIDVYLGPLMDDMKKLWLEGLQVCDGFKKEPFTLHGMILCTVTDLHGGRSVSGQCKGGKDCMHCLDDTENIWLNHSKKQEYVMRRHFHPQSHTYPHMKHQFDGIRETRDRPQGILTGHMSTSR